MAMPTEGATPSISERDPAAEPERRNSTVEPDSHGPSPPLERPAASRPPPPSSAGQSAGTAMKQLERDARRMLATLAGQVTWNCLSTSEGPAAATPTRPLGLGEGSPRRGRGSEPEGHRESAGSSPSTCSQPSTPRSTTGSMPKTIERLEAWGAAGGTLGALRTSMGAASDAVDGIIPALCKVLEATIAGADGALGISGGTPGIATALIVRVLKYKGCSTACIVYGMMYLERLKVRKPGMRLTSRNCRVLLLLAFQAAGKFCDDEGYCSRDWAKLGDISLRELNALELDFLFWLSFDLKVSPEELDSFAASLLVGTEHEHRLTPHQEFLADPVSAIAPPTALPMPNLPPAKLAATSASSTSVVVTEASMLRQLRRSRSCGDLAGEFADSMPAMGNAA